MKQKLPLAAIVAAAVAVSMSIPSRRIASFLASMGGHTIPDEEGKHWQGRMEGADVIRLECQPGRPDYFETRILLKDLDLISIGDDAEEEDPFGSESETFEEVEVLPSGIQPESVNGLLDIVSGAINRLKEAGQWTEDDQAALDEWTKGLPEEEFELLFPETDEQEEEENPGS